MKFHPIQGITATGSGVFPAENAQNISFEFLCANHTSGNGVLTLLG